MDEQPGESRDEPRDAAQNEALGEPLGEQDEKRRSESGARSGTARTPDVLSDRPLEEPHAGRLSPDDPFFAAIIRVHAEALRSGADSYLDPRSGLTVLTAGYLARRGYCCESGCRHCPYVS
jgi:hypothetical protein